MQDKTGIQNYPALLKAVSEIRKMTPNRSKSGTGRHECKKTRGRSKPRKWVACQQYGRHDHGVGGGHRLNKKKQQHANQKTRGLGHERYVFITGSNYLALLSSREALVGVWLHRFDGTTRAKEDGKIAEEFHYNYMVFQGEERLKELGLVCLGRRLWRNTIRALKHVNKTIQKRTVMDSPPLPWDVRWEVILSKCAAREI